MPCKGRDIRGLFNLSIWLTALAGAVVVLAVVQLVTNRGGIGGSSRWRGLRR